MAVAIDDKKPENIEACHPMESVAQGSVDVLASNQLVVDRAIDAIGMGRYQWQLLFSCGFGFLVDQMLLISVTIIMPNAAKEFGPKYQTLLSASLYAGLFVGAVVCSLVADILGRKMVWQLSRFGVSIVTLLAASSPNWGALNVWTSLCGMLAGSNLAIDLTVLAEFLPRRWSFLLTGLASWPLVVQFCCANGTTPEICTRSQNMGWRYIDIVLGALCLIMSTVRSFALGMLESPKWLGSQGEVDEAIVALNLISIKNKSDYPLYNVFLPYYLQSHGANLGDGSNYQTYRDLAISSIVGIFGPLLSAYLVRLPKLRDQGTLFWIAGLSFRGRMSGFGMC
ncbi:major facilitator superfamily domain-containing protein [Aspergillus crustosus]